GMTVVAAYTSGVVDKAFSGNLTITLANNPGGRGAALGGTITVPAVNGVATFSGLTLNMAGAGYTLNISGGGRPAVTTNPFAVTPLGQPTGPSAGLPPSITGEHVVFSQKRKKNGKPIGKPTLAGFRIDFSTAMNQGTIGAAGNYAVEMFVLKKGRRNKGVASK